MQIAYHYRRPGWPARVCTLRLYSAERKKREALCKSSHTISLLALPRGRPFASACHLAVAAAPPHHRATTRLCAPHTASAYAGDAGLAQIGSAQATGSRILRTIPHASRVSTTSYATYLREKKHRNTFQHVASIQKEGLSPRPQAPDSLSPQSAWPGGPSMQPQCTTLRAETKPLHDGVSVADMLGLFLLCP